LEARQFPKLRDIENCWRAQWTTSVKWIRESGPQTVDSQRLRETHPYSWFSGLSTGGPRGLYQRTSGLIEGWLSSCWHKSVYVGRFAPEEKLPYSLGWPGILFLGVHMGLCPLSLQTKSGDKLESSGFGNVTTL
jgi:hypothetical protein